ncbi:unnamed protein product [Urochloa humidicola]
MSCFGAVAETSGYYSPSGLSGGGRRPWRWWRAKCAGIAAAVGSRLRRSIKKGIDGRRRRRRSVHAAQRGCCRQHRRRSFPPVYVDELYSHHHHPPKPLLRVLQDIDDAPTTTGDATKPTPAAAPPVAHCAAAAAARATGGKATTTRASGADGSRVPASPARVGSAAVVSTAGAAMRNVLLRSPGRGGVLGTVKGMGEVDLRAELFIRKFKEDMRLQSQRSAEEFQAMLARGL